MAMLDLEYTVGLFPTVASSIDATLMMTIVGLVIALVLGLVLALVKIIKPVGLIGWLIFTSPSSGGRRCWSSYFSFTTVCLKYCLL